MDSLPAHLSSLDLIHWRWNPNTATGVGEAAQNVWNRAYRREQQRRKRERADDDAVMHEDIKDKPVALAFRIHVPDAEAAVEAEAAVVIDWLRGRDVQLWESFTGMVKRYVDGLKDKVEEGKEDVGMPVEGKGRVLGGAKEGGSVIPGLNRTRF